MKNLPAAVKPAIRDMPDTIKCGKPRTTADVWASGLPGRRPIDSILQKPGTER